MTEGAWVGLHHFRTLIASRPGTIAGSTVFDHLIGSFDIAPTLLEAAGVPVPSGLDGPSFWPALVGQPYEPHEALFSERNYHAGQYDPMRAIRTKTHHYIRVRDPNEFINLADPLVSGPIAHRIQVTGD